MSRPTQDEITNRIIAWLTEEPWDGDEQTARAAINEAFQDLCPNCHGPNHAEQQPTHAAIEENVENSDAVTVTLYFEREPTDIEVRQACEAACLSLSVDPGDEDFQWSIYPNPVSERAGLVRVQAFPAA